MPVQLATGSPWSAGSGFEFDGKSGTLAADDQSALVRAYGVPGLFGILTALKKLPRKLGIRLGRHTLPVLELHVSHACNLSCESCAHYSNHGHRGNLDLALADCWMAAWSQRILVKQFALLGGEPTIHPQLPEFVALVRRHWPKAHVRVVTNGFLLHRHQDLPKALAVAGNASLALSIHHDSDSYGKRLRPVMTLLESWQRDHGTTVIVRPSHRRWTHRYQGSGASMLPFEDGQPRKSWKICPAKSCKQLYDGKIWKCAPIAYLGLQKVKYDLSAKWDPYLRYRPLEATCSDRELDAFLSLEDEPVCAMCSAMPRRFLLPNPIRSAADGELAELAS